MTGIKPEAFSYCPDIQTIDLSDTKVTVIPEECFTGSSSLMEVVLPESVSGIDSKAFGPIPVQSILARACYYYNDKYVFLPYPSLLICRTKVLSRIMSNRFPSTKSSFRMESIFSSNP